MRIGMIGLGRMGANMVKRLRRAGHDAVVYDPNAEAVAALERDGAMGAASAVDLVARLDVPRVIWLMVPVVHVAAIVDGLGPHLAAGDIVVDGGNSHYRDAIDRAERLAARGVDYVDCGTSGGVWGLDRGYCLMLGGPERAIRRLEPVLASLAPGPGAAPPLPGRETDEAPETRGYLHCGPSGAGHFVKMVHNGIEYGMMAAYAEGFNLLRHAGVGRSAGTPEGEGGVLRDPQGLQFDFDLAAIAELWRRGSVVTSWLLDLTAAALHQHPGLEGFSGHVGDSGEGRWTVQTAVEAGVPVHVLSAALFARFDSRGRAEFQNRVLSAMRHAFGGHVERKGEG